MQFLLGQETSTLTSSGVCFTFLKALLKKCKINLDDFQDGIEDTKIKDELKTRTLEAHDKEIFGVPTFVVNNKIFWGQDRLDYALEEYNK